MAKSRNLQVPQSVQDGVDDLSIKFYIATNPDGSKSPHCRMELTDSMLQPLIIDRPVSDITTLTSNQKNNLRTMLTAIRDELFSLEGFS